LILCKNITENSTSGNEIYAKSGFLQNRLDFFCKAGKIELALEEREC